MQIHLLYLCRGVYLRSYILTPVRSTDARFPMYHGSIRWRTQKRRIEPIPNLSRADEFGAITFGDGTPETHRECATNIVTFVRHCGAESQWKEGGIDQFNRELWKAAVKAWGLPVWTANSS
ncbi:hypothetical protein QBC37DRAFT_294714 [Rhypophila decipiens]|uniref:Uncharacterized protein n=1 Tax=Rhypophila decipiens TaxID=261697 RepID=A0AAN6XZA5_9PEZI|nr:hypothetical protein QBC37DRAFT_294714 [Rhypophila decipiens]